MFTGPCEPWPYAGCCCDLTTTSPTTTGIALQAATEVLWSLSGRQFGECEVTLFPCRDVCQDVMGVVGPFEYSGWDFPYPTLMGGLWFNLGCGGGCMGDCSCNTVSQFTLPGPVSRIINITIDGQVVPTGSYRLDNNRRVIRTDGGEWPACNDITQSLGLGTWTATVLYGAEVPMLGQLAVSELMCEFIAACTPGLTCKLPGKLAAVVRQGVQQTFVDPSKYLVDGKIGMYISDLFIATFNPGGLKNASGSYSPDVPRSRFVSV